jgi:TolB-like protein
VSFWSQLRERRLFRIIAGYAAAGWVVLQAADQLTNRGMLPEFVYPLLLIWYLAGIPAALVLGWYHGEKGQQKATKLEVALLVAILVGGLGASSGTVSDEAARRVRLAAAAEGSLDPRNVAVLYFNDHSARGEALHIAEGLTEALIDELSSVRELSVVSRSGVAQFREATLRRDSIAHLLNAGTLVDGSVEQLGDRVLVVVRLLDGQSGAEFRRTSWERPASELLRVRDDLVSSAAALLREWLGEEVRLRRTRDGTSSVQAWAVYQRGERAAKDAEDALRRGDAAAMAASFAAADSLFAQAEVLDPQWTEPAVRRGQVAFRHARFTQDPRESIAIARAGQVHVERALGAKPSLASAYEVRGTLLYWEFLLEAVHDPAELDALLGRARRDLERAVDLDPRRASAHATLSHLYLNRGDEAAAVIAGRRALEEDAWLENADVVIFRLATSSYNLERFNEARRWCYTGRDRFPRDHRFAACELLLMTTPDTEPDIGRAWAVLARLDSLAPPADAEFQHLRGRLLVGGVIARAGAADSARAVWLSARRRVTPAVDPVQWLHFQEAYLRTLVRDYDEAVDLLKRYAAVNAGTSFEHHWWWRELRQHPRYMEIQ